MTKPMAVSIYVGETKTVVALADIERKNMAMVYRQNTEHGAALPRQIFHAVDRLKDYEGIGIAMPGVLDAARGTVHKARNLGVRDLHIVKELERRYKVPAYLTNTSVAGVLGEKLFGAGRGYDNIAWLNMSTGIECGVVLNGRVLLGKQGNAHEIGHTVIDASSDVACGCGRRGHWEAFCSGSGIPNFTRHLLDTRYRGRQTSLARRREITPNVLFRAARSDRIAGEIVDEIGRLNTIGLANIVELYDPELVSIGGWLPIEYGNAILAPITRNIGRYIARLNKRPKITLTQRSSKFWPWLYGAVADFL